MKLPLFSIAIIFLIALLSAGYCAAQSLEEGFSNPPRQFSPVPFWSWNGTLEPDELRRQIDEMVAKGVYGALMHARVGLEGGETPYFSEGWWRAVETCVAHGEEVGFYPWIYDEDKWPSGAAGGRTLERDPIRNRQKVLRHAEQHISGPTKVPIDFPDAHYVIAGRILAEGALDPGTLTVLLRSDDSPSSSGKQEWACPPGEWLVIAYMFEPFRDGINYLNADTVRDFIDITHEEYARRFGEYFGTLIPGVFFDEIMNEAGKHEGYTVWVEGFEERFKALKGYDIAPLLPALDYDIGAETPKVRCDYYDVYTDFYENAWFKQIADWCAAHDLDLTGHTVEDMNRYVTQGNYMRTMRHLQIPMTDNEDFRYTWPRTVGPWKPKQIASVAHLYGQPRVGVEAMAGSGWPFTPDLGRYGFNMLSAYGLNYFVSSMFHYAQDSPESVGDWPSSWFFRNPYWKYYKTLADHTSRLSYMLTGGRPVVDVAILYPDANLWSGYGEGTTEAAINHLVSQQIDADLIDTVSLLRAEIESGTLRVGAMNYKVLILPGIRCMREQEAEKIEAFIDGGGAVFIHDRWPTDSMDVGRDDPWIAAFVEHAVSKGISPINLEDTARLVTDRIVRDMIVHGDEPSPLRYQHVVRDDRDVYWLANGSLESGAWTVTFRAVGSPSIWQPEDGSIAPVTAFVRKGSQTEFDLSLDGRQGCFVVFDTSIEPREGGARIEESTLASPSLESFSTEESIVTGLAGPGQSEGHAQVTVKTGAEEVVLQGRQVVVPPPPLVSLGGTWRFLPVGNQLDDDWRVDVQTSTLELPVMRVRWQRQGENAEGTWHLPGIDDDRWRSVKILDALHPEAGADRYRSRWVGRLISSYVYTPFDLERFYVPTFGGKGLKCRKQFLLPPEATRGWLAIVSDSPFRVFVDDTECGGGEGGALPVTVALEPLRAGETTLTIATEKASTVLAEGQFVQTIGAPIPIFTDDTWQVRTNETEWMQAWVYVAPPEQPFGEPQFPEDIPMPDTVWYRQPLPPGTNRIYEPEIDGHWTAWLDGAPLVFTEGVSSLSVHARAATLVLRVTLGEGQHGLLRPVKVGCVPTEQPLGSWTNQNLDWYTGRALYSTDFALDATHVADDVRLQLNLGKVCYCAEIWVNGRLAATRIWPPYETDITEYVQVGVNRLDIVVANLIANRMVWDIFDDSKTNLINRRWHDSNIRRDAWCLESGLIGPVHITPYRRVSVSCRRPAKR